MFQRFARSFTGLSVALNQVLTPGETVMSNLGPALAWQTNHAVLHLALTPEDVRQLLGEPDWAGRSLQYPGGTPPEWWPDHTLWEYEAVQLNLEFGAEGESGGTGNQGCDAFHDAPLAARRQRRLREVEGPRLPTGP
jgi:hypothetical protein